MSQTVKITFSDKDYKALDERAQAKSQTVQDYIRGELFPGQVNAVTPDSAVTLALQKYKSGDRFSVPEIFGEDWKQVDHAGVFGKKFNALVNEKYSDKIKFTDSFNKKGQAVYEII